MLIPLFGIGRLVSEDAHPLAEDDVVRAILAVKHAPNVTPDLLDDLESFGGLTSRLVVVDVDWTPGWPRMTYAVESYDLTSPEVSTVFRYADGDGVWWAGTGLHARQHGKGMHRNPQLWRRDVGPSDVLASFRTRFGRQTSPVEYVCRPVSEL